MIMKAAWQVCLQRGERQQRELTVLNVLMAQRIREEASHYLSLLELRPALAEDSFGSLLHHLRPQETVPILWSGREQRSSLRCFLLRKHIHLKVEITLLYFVMRD
jgi:hypothetical protein